MKTPPIPPRTQGFALVITLSLMILLTVIAVGLLGLSAISMDATSQGEAMAVAQSNARLAMMLAIGDLQKTAGTDRAITAPAAIIGDQQPSGVTGVWSPWDPGSSSSPHDKAARAAKFKQWLVSTVDGKGADIPDKPPLTAVGTADSVTLLGNGSLGKLDDQRINLPTTRVVNGKALSGLAWAVIDEGAKSRIDLYHDDKTDKSWTNVTRVAAPPTDGAKTLPGWDQFKIPGTDNGKLITVNTVSLNGTVKRDDVSLCDPDITVSSNSLMTDPVNGGIKKDLSLFCSRGLSAGEQTARLYNYAGVIADNVPSDPYLALLANYHQLYKRLGQANSNSVAIPGPYQIAARLPAGQAPYAAYAPYGNDTNGLTVVNRSVQPEPLLVPAVVRVDIIFSMVTRNTHGGWTNFFGSERPYELHMQYLPVVTLHNPFSVPLVFEGLHVAFKNLPVGFNYIIDGQDLSTRLVALNQMYVNLAGSDTASKDFGITLKPSGSATFMTLEPGQTKLFGTPKVTPDWTWFMESPGAGADGIALFDWRNDKTSNFNMSPKLITTSASAGAGFDIDWINPVAAQTAKGAEVGKSSSGMCGLKGSETIAVKFGPYAPPAGMGTFSVEIGLIQKGVQVKAGGITVNYGTQDRLNSILSKGTSVRFPTTRNFPETIPKPGMDPEITVPKIYEDGNTAISGYVNPKQFMIFSLAAKTTLESFIPAQTLLAGNPTTNVAAINLTQGGDPEGSVPFEMVMMPISARNGAAIEDNRNLEEGYFFSGNGSLNGTPRATLYELPVAPLESLAQFRHANLAGSGFMPFVTYTVGESNAHPNIGTATTRGNWTDHSVMLDHTFLSNEALWDSWYLSTVADQSGPLFSSAARSYADVLKEFFDGKGKLLNDRFTPYNHESTSVPEVVGKTADGNDSYTKLGAYLMLSGGFNVNSTSENAWKAVLAALDGADIETVTGVDPAKTGEYPAPRVRRPAEKHIDPTTIGMNLHQSHWQGYRRLTKAQIDELAKEIVKEVRSRGPYLSLADFVNRRLGPDSDPVNVKGALQAAIDRTTINTSILKTEGRGLAAKDVALNGYQSVQAGIGNTAANAPGVISQGDVLSAIGSRIAVRADTFRIRGYGEARDATGKKILAKAWCEVIVQRVPDFVDPNDRPYAEYGKVGEINKKFGRRYQIVSFRWLGPREV